MFLRIPFACITLLFFAAYGCVRTEDVAPAESTYTFKNGTDAQVYLDLYETQDDYNHNPAKAARYTIDENGALKLPLKVGATYWLDWYTVDYRYNNWSSAIIAYLQAGAGPLPELKIAAEPDTRTLFSNGDTARSVLLAGNGLSSTWEMKLSGTLSSNGTYRFEFRKDFSGIYTYIGGSLNAVSQDFQYKLAGIRRDYFRLAVTVGNVQIADVYFNADPSSYPHFGRDTLMANIRSESYYNYYPLLRR